MSSALDVVLPGLRCPHCGDALHRVGGQLRCGTGHTFDVARQGYVSLRGGGGRHHGDTSAMVGDRERFLASGHYRPVADAVTVAVAATTPPAGLLLDLAAGTGWYGARALDAEPGRYGVALDVSAPALRRAARAHERMAAVGADAWAPLPVRDGCAAVVLSVFGPRTPAELARVLVPGGCVVVATPAPEHLAELRGPVGLLDVRADKTDRLAAAFAGFTASGRRRVTSVLQLPRADVRALVGMGPTAHHVPAAELEARVAALAEPVAVTLAVDVSTFRPS